MVLLIGGQTIPLAELATLLSTRMFQVALASKNVIVQKENFAVLSKHLEEIQPLLADIGSRETSEEREVRDALQKLQSEVIMAQQLVEECIRKSRFFLLLKCRQYAKRLEITTREIGRCLSILLESDLQMSPTERDQLENIEKQMQSVQFQAAEKEASVCDKLEKALTERRDDTDFVNGLLTEIAEVCGIPSECDSLTMELASFRREKEEAMNKKEMAEGAYLEQVALLLGKADVANSESETEREYLTKRTSVCDGMTSVLPPLQAFICPITAEVMNDPVSLASGQTYERSAIEAWLKQGNLTCPVTGVVVGKEGSTISLHTNRALKDSIREWRDHNYVITVRSARMMLESGSIEQQSKALVGLEQACKERPGNRCWVRAEGILPVCVEVLKSESKGLRIQVLRALLSIVKSYDRNKILAG